MRAMRPVDFWPDLPTDNIADVTSANVETSSDRNPLLAMLETPNDLLHVVKRHNGRTLVSRLLA